MASSAGSNTIRTVPERLFPFHSELSPAAAQNAPTSSVIGRDSRAGQEPRYIRLLSSSARYSLDSHARTLSRFTLRPRPAPASTQTRGRPLENPSSRTASSIANLPACSSR
eukprot:676637-Rhodomonas_salina.1